MHTIRLRGPWQVEAVERYVKRDGGGYDRSTDALPAEARVTMPADWGQVLGATFFGRVRYRRTFQKPTGLDSGERVWLVVEAPRTRGEVELNRKRLGETCRGESQVRFDITDLLQEHNRLEVLVEHPALDAHSAADDDGGTNLAGGLVGEVRLEIEE
jgi:beta-galactosidase/beta-glucuronidase